MSRLKRRILVLPMLILGYLLFQPAAFSLDPLTPLTSQKGWTQPLPNPVIQAGDLRAKGIWNDPDIQKVGNTYVLYMTSPVNQEDPTQPPVLPFRAVSSDAVNWRLDPPTPLLSTEGTKLMKIETPNVVYFNGMYHMYFTSVYAYPPKAAKDFAIGHAISPDGIRWTIDREQVLTATGNLSDWNGFLVAEPGAIVHNNQIYLYFNASGVRDTGVPPSIQSIGLAKTSDGINFTPPVRVIQQAPVYPPQQGYTGYSTPEPFKLGKRIHLVYDVALDREDAEPNWQQVAIHHASSADGETNFVQDAQPLLIREDFNFTRGEIIGPTVLVENGQVKMWFGGHLPHAELGTLFQNNFVGPEFGIGHVTRSAADFK